MNGIEVKTEPRVQCFMCRRWVRVDVLRKVYVQFPEEPEQQGVVCLDCHRKLNDHGPCRLLMGGRSVQVWLPLSVT